MLPPDTIAELPGSGQRAPAAGHVFWITGLSGVGKSTAARSLAVRLRETQPAVICLDGDDLRAVYGDMLAFSPADRRTLAFRHARLCRLLSSQGFDVVCATICLIHDCHAWCRQNLAHYHEIYLRASLKELCRRDRKGLYQSALSGERRDVVGVDLPAEEPLAPHLVIDSDGQFTPEDVAEQIWRYAWNVKRGADAG